MILSRGESKAEGFRVSPRLLEFLVCPVTGGILRYDSERCELLSSESKLAFPIRLGIPVMLVEEARVIK